MSRSIASILLVIAIALGVWAGMVIFLFLTGTFGVPA